MQLGCGAVLLSPGRRPEYFGFLAPQELVEHWRTACSKKTVINQAELWPALVARTTWPHLLRGKRLLHFIDNDGARDALIRGYSPVAESNMMVGATWLADTALGTFVWYTRVPSEANLSDGPSRLDFSAVEAMGYLKVEAVLPDWQPTSDELPDLTGLVV